MMKKYLLLCASAGLVSLNAQVPSPGVRNESEISVIPATPAQIQMRLNATYKSPVAQKVGPAWVEPSEAVRAVQGGLATSYNNMIIFPDTNAYFTYSSGTSKNYTNSMGIVMDPRSVLYDVSGPFMLSRWNPYTVDSMRFQMYYRRFNTDPNIRDTIVVSTFDRTSIDRGRYFPTLYAGVVNYTPNKFTASGSGVFTQYVSLGVSDTSSIITLPVGKTVPGNNGGFNWFGATISYIPGYKGYNHPAPFDTVSDFTKTGPYDTAKTSNAFGLLTYFDDKKYGADTTSMPIAGQRIYNHGIVALQTQRYKIPVNGEIRDYYYPAYYTNAHAFPVIDFLITSPNVAIKNIDNNGNGVGTAYPNPTNGAMAFTVPFKLATAGTVTINVVDLSGKIVKSVSNNYKAGNNEISFETANLNNGIYLYEMINGQFKSSGKIIVQ